jgi:type II secretory ATPase GspE/PulE/Tfp pilus assembly ATPase PilB-like protein
MIDLIGVNPIFSSSIRLLIAQRLVRRLDDNKEEYEPDESVKRYIRDVMEGVDLSDYDFDLHNIKLWREKPSDGSPFGFNGRTAIMEQLVVTEPIQKFIRGDVRDINTNEIEKTARAEGMLTLEQKGVIAALRGETTIDEIGRVI